METVRCAVFRSKDKYNEVLMLQKDVDSKNPYALEFPGGKMIDNAWQGFLYNLTPNKRNFQRRQIQREMEEETGLHIPLAKIQYLGERKYKNSATKQITDIYNFFTVLEKDEPVSLNNIGKDEDKHARFFWLGFKKFRHYCQQREGTRKGFVCKNSRYPMLWRSVFA